MSVTIGFSYRKGKSWWRSDFLVFPQPCCILTTLSENTFARRIYFLQLLALASAWRALIAASLPPPVSCPSLIPCFLWTWGRLRWLRAGWMEGRWSYPGSWKTVWPSHPQGWEPRCSDPVTSRGWSFGQSKAFACETSVSPGIRKTCSISI